MYYFSMGLAGIKYEQENEDDFKDKQDFVAPPPQHYPPGGEWHFCGLNGCWIILEWMLYYTFKIVLKKYLYKQYDF